MLDATTSPVSWTSAAGSKAWTAGGACCARDDRQSSTGSTAVSSREARAPRPETRAAEAPRRCKHLNNMTRSRLHVPRLHAEAQACGSGLPSGPWRSFFLDARTTEVVPIHKDPEVSGARPTFYGKP